MRWISILALTLALSGSARPADPPAKEPTHGGKTVDQWVADLRSGKYEVVNQACVALGKIGPPARAAVPDLVNTLRAANTNAEPAARALVAVRPDPKEVTPALLEIIGRGGVPMTAAAHALARIDPKAAVGVIPALLQTAESPPGEKARSFALQAIAALGPAARPGLPGLIRLLDHYDSTVRVAAARAVGQIGPDAREAVPHLIPLLTDWSGSPSFAVEALAAIGPGARAAVPHLIRGLHRKRKPVGPFDSPSAGPGYDPWREALVQALWKIGPASGPALVDALTDPDPIVRLAAADTLGLLAKDGAKLPAEAVPALVAALTGDEGYANAAARALGEFGAAAESAVPRLLKALQADYRTSGAAADALGKIGPPARPTLLRMIKDPAYDSRPLAARALGGMGPAAREAVPDLIELARVARVRGLADAHQQMVAQAIWKIDPEAAARAGIPK